VVRCARVGPVNVFCQRAAFISPDVCLAAAPRVLMVVEAWMMMMMRGFVERVINSPQTRCRSAKQVGLQMSSERQRGESCSSQSGW